jgi:hypothetical protein
MLELLLLWGLSSWIGRIVEQKGLNKWPYQLMLVLFWFGGEITGGIFGFVAMSQGGGPQNDEALAMVYVFALGGAVLGAVMAFVIANAQDDQRRQRYRPQDDSPRNRAFGDEGRWGDVKARWRDAQGQGGNEVDRVACRDCGFRFLAVLDRCPKCQLPANEGGHSAGSDRITDR